MLHIHLISIQWDFYMNFNEWEFLHNNRSYLKVLSPHLKYRCFDQCGPGSFVTFMPTLKKVLMHFVHCMIVEVLQIISLLFRTKLHWIHFNLIRSCDTRVFFTWNVLWLLEKIIITNEIWSRRMYMYNLRQKVKIENIGLLPTRSLLE